MSAEGRARAGHGRHQYLGPGRRIDGNVQHLREHDVTIEEAEEVLFDPRSSRAVSRTSGLPTAFGWTSTGRHLAVVYELVDDDPLTLRPVTAYDVPPPRPRRNGGRDEGATDLSRIRKTAEERAREQALRESFRR